MSVRLTDFDMLTLVKTYKDNPCLWDVTSNLYKKRKVRERAYKAILEKLNVPGLSIEEIPNKIKNMRSSYYSELKRIQKSNRSGAVYRPKVSWFGIAHGFLSALRNKQEAALTIDESSSTVSENDTVPQNNEDCYNANLNATDNINNTEDNNIKNDDSLPVLTVFPMQPSKINKNKSKDINTAIDRLDNIAKSVTNATKSIIENEHKEDEFDIFGKYIAMTVRSLPNELAIIAKTNIQKAVSDVQMKALRQSTEAASVLYPTCYLSSAPESRVE